MAATDREGGGGGMPTRIEPEPGSPKMTGLQHVKVAALALELRRRGPAARFVHDTLVRTTDPRAQPADAR